jgi:isoquinoline 1-oxidoreductase beta subunit
MINMTRTRKAAGLNRRELLAGSAGLSFAFALGAPSFGEAQAQPGGRLNAYVTIATDGTITVMAPAPEMGQGVNTSLPLIVAEELDADWSKVKVRAAPIQAVYNHPILKGQIALASISSLGYWMPCRTAGAQARRVLLDAAAERWGVPAGELTTQPSTVVHAASGRKLSYGEIAGFAKVPAQLPEIKPDQLKPVKQFRLIGKDVPRVDVPDKVSGQPLYAIDVQIPGMLYGTLARSPVRGSAPVSFNRDEIKTQPGIVEVVQLDHGIGIIGRSVEAVFSARNKLQAQWGEAPGSKVDSEKNLEEYVSHARDFKQKTIIGRKRGEPEAAIAQAAKVLTTEVTTDYAYHAQMEPLSCAASVTPEAVEIWAGTQWPTKAVAESAKAAGVAEDKVKLHPLQMGGGFGRRLFVDTVVDAVLLSKAAGKPVKMVQTRADDVAAGRFRPMTAHHTQIGLDADSKVIGWRHRIAADLVVPQVYGQERMDTQKGHDHIITWMADVAFYDVAAHMAEHIYEERGVRTAAWRGVGAGHNNFAIETAVDELAHLMGEDPLQYRLDLLKDPRAKKVVETAASLADWSRKREGRGLGISFAAYGPAPPVSSMIGTVAEISVDRQTGNIRVHNVWCAADPGLPVQPGNVAAQVEGAVIFALGAALKERITLKDGRVEQSNFHDYELMRMSEVPEIKVEVIRSRDAPLPVGELGIPGTVPAVANAFFALTGKRLRHAPFTPARVKAALA